MNLLFMCVAALLGLGTIATGFFQADKEKGELQVDKLESVEEVRPQVVFKGDWVGELGPLTLALHVGQEGATLDSLEQLSFGMVVDELVEEGSSLAFAIHDLQLRFEGSYEGEEIKGTLTQYGQVRPLTFHRGSVQMNRPQLPQPPYPYREAMVRYSNGEVSLAGTLTLPAGEGPFPVVLLVAGLGPQIRDKEVVPGHKTFLVLADHLTKAGIAVLRVDKRGCGESTGSHEEAVFQDFASDALAGIAYLKSLSEIDSQKVGIIGHSQGGSIASLVAAGSSDVGFLVLMASVGVDGESFWLKQQEDVNRLRGFSEDLISLDLNYAQQIYAVMKKSEDKEAMKSQVRALLEYLKEERIRVDPNQESKINDTLEEVLFSNWFYSFLTMDPSIALQQVKVPVLALNGAKDAQVSSKQNLIAIDQALLKGGNGNYTIVEFPHLNHLFQTCDTGSVTEYAEIEETIAPVVLKTIAEWIVKQTEKT